MSLSLSPHGKFFTAWAALIYTFLIIYSFLRKDSFLFSVNSSIISRRQKSKILDIPLLVSAILKISNDGSAQRPRIGSLAGQKLLRKECNLGGKVTCACLCSFADKEPPTVCSRNMENILDI